MSLSRKTLVSNLEVIALAQSNQQIGIGYDENLQLSDTISNEIQREKVAAIVRKTFHQSLFIEQSVTERIWVEIKDGQHNNKLYSVGYIARIKSTVLECGSAQDSLKSEECPFMNVVIKYARQNWLTYRNTINPEKSQLLRDRLEDLTDRQQAVELLYKNITFDQLEAVFAFFKTGVWSEDFSFKDYLAIWNFGNFLQSTDLKEKAEESLSQLPFTREVFDYFESSSRAKKCGVGVPWASKRIMHEVLFTLKSYNKPTQMGELFLNRDVLSTVSFASFEEVKNHITAKALQKLDMSAWRNISNEQFGSILEQCPNLTELKLPIHLSGNVLKHLQWVPKLQKLDISGCTKLQDDCLDMLLFVTHLQSLNITACTQLNNDSLKHLYNVRDLKSLNITRCTQLNADCLENLMYVPDLLYLNISYCGNLLKNCLSQLANVQGLKSLNIEGCKHLPAQSLLHLSYVPRLLDLNISDCDQLQSSSLNYLEHVPKLLNLSMQRCTQLEKESLSKLSYVPNLRSLDAESCQQLSSDCLKQLQHVPNLLHLNMSRCNQLASDSLDYLIHIPNLESLNIKGCALLAPDCLVRLEEVPHLKSLNATWCSQLSENSLENLQYVTTLRELNIRNCTKLSADSLKNLKHVKKLQHLSIPGCTQLKTNCLDHLKHVPHLLYLNIENCTQLRPDSLSQLKNVPYLQDLNVSMCDKLITDNLMDNTPNLSSLRAIALKPVDQQRLQEILDKKRADIQVVS